MSLASLEILKRVSIMTAEPCLRALGRWSELTGLQKQTHGALEADACMLMKSAASLTPRHADK